MKESFDAERFTRDHNITTADYSSKHFREGWINVDCPFCAGNPGQHLGYHIEECYWNCWRCGWHSEVEVVQTLLQITWQEALKIAKTYGSRPHYKESSYISNAPASLALPFTAGPLQKRHKRYLRERNFSPRDLKETWGLLGTGIFGAYKFRIIAPIYHKGHLVSYQGRDITDRAKLKYKACKAENELIPHKHLLYGLNHAQGHSIVVVEGITDVWRLGPGAVATFGIEWSTEQALLLKDYARVFIMYDFGEAQAIRQAKSLGYTLSGLGVQVELITSPGHKGDPATLSNRRAQGLMKEIRGF